MCMNIDPSIVSITPLFEALPIANAASLKLEKRTPPRPLIWCKPYVERGNRSRISVYVRLAGQLHPTMPRYDKYTLKGNNDLAILTSTKVVLTLKFRKGIR